jgi:uncharacterized protein (DUF4213/DUF364 family)
MILDQTFELLKTKYKDEIKDIFISDVRVGVFLTAIKLSNGSFGVASTNVDSHSNCYKKKRDFDDFSPAKIKGQYVLNLFNNSSEFKIINTLKVAVLNAMSSLLISNSNYKIIENADPIDLIDLTPQKTITIVGAFQSYIKKIVATKNNLYVLELDENALNEEQKKYYVPADEFSKVLPISDVVIITGLTLVNNTLDNLLKSILPHTKVIITGPSSSIIPDVLFRYNVKIVGSTRIKDPDLLFTVVSEAGTGFHLFKYCAEKFSIINE